MAGPSRNPLDFGLGERSFAQRFILAEILGPPKARTAAPAAPRPPVQPPADAATQPTGRDAQRGRSG
jgi:hypothetical protein